MKKYLLLDHDGVLVDTERWCYEAGLQEIPMQRFGEPSEVASVALFLASDLAAYMTGTVLEVTGGRHM